MRTIRLLATLAVSGTAMAGVLTPATAHADTTSCGSLPSWVQGRPAGVHAQAPLGDYIWHNSYGWHLRVTHRGIRRMVFTGVITASAPIHVRLVRDERQDHVALSGDRSQLSFRLVNYGGIDGFDFVDGCAGTQTFSLRINGVRTPLSRIVVGASSTHPDSNPFTVTRVASSDAPTGS